MPKFQDKVVVVTGGASGIGAGVADAFAQEGAHVAVVRGDFVGICRPYGNHLFAVTRPVTLTPLSFGAVLFRLCPLMRTSYPP